MGLADFFRKRTPDPLNPKVLVCSLGPGFEPLVIEDEGAYRRYFPDTKITNFETSDELFSEMANGYEIVHLYTHVTPDGCIGTSTISGTELIKNASNAGTKLLWIANDNNPDGYIKDFNPTGNKLNLVMTIHRLGNCFPDFLRDLLGEMKSGASMPVAWNRIAPQIPGKDQPGIPETIFFCGLGQARFI